MTKKPPVIVAHWCVDSVAVPFRSNITAGTRQTSLCYLLWERVICSEKVKYFHKLRSQRAASVARARARTHTHTRKYSHIFPVWLWGSLVFEQMWADWACLDFPPPWPERALPAPKANTQREQSQSVPSEHMRAHTRVSLRAINTHKNTRAHGYFWGIERAHVRTRSHKAVSVVVVAEMRVNQCHTHFWDFCWGPLVTRTPTLPIRFRVRREGLNLRASGMRQHDPALSRETLGYFCCVSVRCREKYEPRCTAEVKVWGERRARE